MNLYFMSEEHEQAFDQALEVTKHRSEYFADDRFYQAMIYILTSDYLRCDFDLITNDTDEIFEIIPEVDSKISSTKKFMMSYALKLYFSSVKNDYDFAYWFYQLDPQNQMIMLESLKFLQHY